MVVAIDFHLDSQAAMLLAVVGYLLDDTFCVEGALYGLAPATIREIGMSLATVCFI